MGHPAWWAAVADRMAAFQRQNPANLPGAVLAVETRDDGPLITAVGEGWSTGTICTLASMSKTFTATAVLLALEEHAELDVDLPVAEFPGMDLYAGDPVRKRITVRHLLQHTSGMPLFLPYDVPVGPFRPPREAPEVWPEGLDTLGPTVRWMGSPGDTNEMVTGADGTPRPARTATLDEVSASVMNAYPLVHEPGAEYTYSSANHVVAGRLVERLTGQAPNVYVRRRLFEPLGMRDSFFVAQPPGDPGLDAYVDEGVSEAQRARVAELSLITHDGRWPPEIASGPGGGWDPLRRGWRYVYPDGGMYSTATDLLRYLRALRDDGDGVLSPAVTRLLTADQGWGSTMALGFRTTTTPYGQGPGTLDHLGNLMTYFWYDPRPRDPVLGVFLSQRLANAVVKNNMADGMRAIFGEFVPAVYRERR
jgi:CubicO group peptidase (beta-lactamase class C family)